MKLRQVLYIDSFIKFKSDFLFNIATSSTTLKHNSNANYSERNITTQGKEIDEYTLAHKLWVMIQVLCLLNDNTITNENLTKMKNFYIMVSVSVFGHARTVSILKCVHDIRKLTASLQTMDHNTLIYIVKGRVQPPSSL